MEDIILQLRHSKSVIKMFKKQRKYLRIDVFVLNEETKQEKLNFVNKQIKIERKRVLKLIDKL